MLWNLLSFWDTKLWTRSWSPVTESSLLSLCSILIHSAEFVCAPSHPFTWHCFSFRDGNDGDKHPTQLLHCFVLGWRIIWSGSKQSPAFSTGTIFPSEANHCQKRNCLHKYETWLLIVPFWVRRRKEWWVLGHQEGLFPAAFNSGN